MHYPNSTARQQLLSTKDCSWETVSSHSSTPGCSLVTKEHKLAILDCNCRPATRDCRLARLDCNGATMDWVKRGPLIYTMERRDCKWVM